MSYWLQFITIIILVTLSDICWTMYFIKVGEKKSFAAASWSSIILLFGALTTINYVHDKTLIIAAAIGGFIGTFISVEYNKRKNKE